MTHGICDFKTINFQEAKAIGNYRNIKFKPLINNSSIRFNKQRNVRHITTTYARMNKDKKGSFKYMTENECFLNLI